jgi:hypothetical protein
VGRVWWNMAVPLMAVRKQSKERKLGATKALGTRHNPQSHPLTPRPMTSFLHILRFQPPDKTASPAGDQASNISLWKNSISNHSTYVHEYTYFDRVCVHIFLTHF